MLNMLPNQGPKQKQIVKIAMAETPGRGVMINPYRKPL